MTPPIRRAGATYYTDVYDPETIAWLRAYFLAHPDDQYIGEKLAEYDCLTAERQKAKGAAARLQD